MMEMIESVWPSMRMHASSKSKKIKNPEDLVEVKEEKIAVIKKIVCGRS